MTNGTEENAREDQELNILTQIRLALSSTLRMLECARDDLVVLGMRIDRLSEASVRCRHALIARERRMTK